MILEESVALDVLEELGRPDPPMNAFSLANALGIKVVASNVRSASLAGNVIFVSTHARDVRQHGLIAHELGHWALIQADQPDTEVAASYVGAALMLPRTHFDRDLHATSWDLRELRAKHVHCSAELIARRIVALRDAVVSIWDNGRLKTRIASPWLPEGYRRISTFELELAERVLEDGDTVQAGKLAWGFAVFSESWRRVITVCEAEQLALRYSP